VGTPIRIEYLPRIQVRVPLRGGEAGVPEQLLDGTQIGAALQKMSGKAVTQRVRANPLTERDLAHAPLDEAANRAITESPAGTSHEDGLRAEPASLPHRQVARQSRVGRATERNDAFFSPFSQNAKRPRREVHVRQIESDEFGTTDSRCVEKLEDGACAQAGIIFSRYIKKLSDIDFLEPRGQLPLGFRGAERARRVPADNAFSAEKPKVCAERGQLPRGRRFSQTTPVKISQERADQ
jgi:hypothetical protein